MVFIPLIWRMRWRGECVSPEPLKALEGTDERIH